MSPSWYLNHSVAATGPFLHVPVDIVPPACRPRLAPAGPLSWRISGRPGDPLKAALRQGTFLDKQQVKAILVARGIPLPESGSNKPDLLLALLRGTFPDDNEAAIQKLLKRQAKQPGSVPAPAETETTGAEEDPELLLMMTAALNSREAEYFEDIRGHAVEQLEAKKELQKTQRKIAEEREQPPDSAARGSTENADEPRASGAVGPRGAQEHPARTKTKAPKEFLNLLPDVQNLYFHWEPQNRRVWMEFRSASYANHTDHTERLWLAGIRCAPTPAKEDCRIMFRRRVSAHGARKLRSSTRCPLFARSWSGSQGPTTRTAAQPSKTSTQRKAPRTSGLAALLGFSCS